MGSKGRIPPHQLRRPLPGPGIGHPDPFTQGLRPPHGVFPPFDMMPSPEIIEQKLAAQHADMQKLATENQRLAATHGTLRQELAAAQHELQMLHGHMGAIESEREQRIRCLVERIGKMEADLQGAEPLKIELQKARADAQELLSARQGLVAKVKDLTQDLQKAHADMQQFQGLMSELESLRQEFQQCRATYDYEKKVYNDHLESLQVMEKNYMTMAQEVEKLRAELTNAATVDRRSGVSYGVPTGYNENDTTGHYPVTHNPYDNYGIQQGHGPLPGGSGPLPGGSGGGGSGSIAATTASAGASTAAGGRSSHDKSGTPHVGDKSETAPVGLNYDAPRGPGYATQKGFQYNAQSGIGAAGYDAQRGITGAAGYGTQRGYGGAGYDSQKGPITHGYDVQRGPNVPGYDAQRGSADAQRGHVHNAQSQRGAGYNIQRGPGYEPQGGSSGYNTQRGPGYEPQGGSSYDARKGTDYDGQRGPGSGFEAHRASGYDQGRAYTHNTRI